MFWSFNGLCISAWVVSLHKKLLFIKKHNTSHRHFLSFGQELVIYKFTNIKITLLALAAFSLAWSRWFPLAILAHLIRSERFPVRSLWVVGINFEGTVSRKVPNLGLVWFGWENSGHDDRLFAFNTRICNRCLGCLGVRIPTFRR